MFIYSNILRLFIYSNNRICLIVLTVRTIKLIFIIYNLKKLKVSMVEDSGIEPLTS